MLELVLGRAGFGKTEYVRQELVRLAGTGTPGLMLLVPDQFSFDTEKAILALAGPAVAAKIQVFTFSRLAEEVNRLYGGITEKRVDDSGRTLLMSLAVTACEDQLYLYRDTAKGDRMVSLMLLVVEEFKASAVTPEELFAVSERATGALKEKTYEIALVYAAFEALLKGSYIEPSELITRLGEMLGSRDFFKGKTLYIDGFEGFNRQKLAVLRAALRDCARVVCTLACDALYDEDEESMFAPLRETGRRLAALAKEEGAGVAVPLKLAENRRSKSKDLRYLEEKLFRNEQTLASQSHGGIVLYESRDVYGEADYVAATIRNLVMQGYRYGEISVICRDAHKYFSVIENAFRKWEIPAFIAGPEAVDAAPLMRLVLSAFTVLEYGFRTEDVLTLLKTGLCGLDGAELSALENYVYIWKISGGPWKLPFVKAPGGFGVQVDEAALLELETIRRRVVLPLVRFGKNTADATGREISAAIYTLLTDLGSDTALPQGAEKLRASGQEDLAREQLRLWKTLMDILDRFAAILGDRKTPRARYGTLLRQVLSKEEMRDIPLRLDTVLFGTADQVKQENPRVTFLLGAVQGQFPLIPTENGVFTGNERRVLAEMKLPLEGSFEEETLLERFYTYSAACAAGEKLYISYHLSNGRDDFAPSELVSCVQGLFSNSRIEKGLPRTYFANSRESAFSAAAQTLRENTPESLALRAVFEGDSGYAGRLDALRRLAENAPFTIQDKALSKKMFEGNALSPSQIDTYHRCRFQYFCKYGLGAKERKPAEINVLEYGTLMHYLFECVFREHFERYSDPLELRDKISQLIRDYADERMGGFEQMSPRDKYRFKRMADTAVLLILRVIEELSQSDFKPAYLELALTNGGEFPPLTIQTQNGGEVTVGGVIDRVDIYDSPRGRYVRVVDYKTGHKEFKLTDVLYGLNLQMLIYLAALQKKGLLSAGALYMPSAFPTVSANKGMSEEKIMSEVDKKLCMSGIVLSDEEIIKAMEKGANGKYIPVGINTKGGISKPDNALSGNELQMVFTHVEKLIGTMANELSRGNIEAKPLMLGTDSCAWCPFGAVCAREREEPWDIRLSKDEAIAKMREDGAEHG